MSGMKYAVILSFALVLGSMSAYAVANVMSKATAIFDIAHQPTE